ncbi:Flp pilus assembly protein CpaB [Cohnella candidum]|uniref:Flp pilus assembly protein CpaB n=1 Tax=Cohnella candidum TaxID=2674991 RepID=A0A3G3K3C4_9BACL|nr:Flp pilus assembly protein CpaB [Cohnella candidum]AYQ75006.1 Flp pilus assembly protein CpaB [Cohnella candidum]
MRSKIILMAALVMGIVTTVLFFNYMKKYDAAAAVNETFVSVVAAKQEIKENTKITGAMLQTIQIPANGVHASTIKDLALAEGKVAASDLAAGEVILANHIKDQQAEAQFVSKKVRDGYRAVSLGVNLVQSVSNLIEPEDYVDLVFTETDPDTKKVQSSILLENVRVLAIGRRMVQADATTEYVEYATVTLEVKPEDGVTVINSDEKGPVSLMLHSRVVQEDGGSKP